MEQILGTIGSLGNVAGGIIGAVKGSTSNPANAQTSAAKTTTPTLAAPAWTKWAMIGGGGLVLVLVLVLIIRRR